MRAPSFLRAARRFAVAALPSTMGGVALASVAACAPAPAPASPPVVSAAPSPSASSASLPPPTGTPEQRAEVLLQRMTLAEKIAYIGGDREFYIRAVPRLGIPEIKMADGPAGCRNWGPSIAYPAPVGLAATFDVGMAERVGRAIGRDCRARGVHILLAPGVNIARSPLGGRNFEYLGEDPFLAGKTAAAYIRGVQGEGVLATVKHFAGNNQEWDRHHVSSEIDERALREIYLPAFERAVREGHVRAVMTAYNLLNGVYCSHDPWLLNQVLKKEWGFTGFVMSDWRAVEDALAAAKAGLDLEMPDARHMSAANLTPLLQQNALDVATLDEKVRRILRTIIEAGFLDSTQKRDDIPLDDPRDAGVSLEAARRSIVLLKNTGHLLPLDRAKTKRIAVIGPNAMPAVTGGSGSALVTPVRPVSVLEGIGRIGAGIEVDYHPGVRQIVGDGGPSNFEGGDDVTAIAHRADVVVVSVGFGQSADTNSVHKAYRTYWPEDWARQAGIVESEGTDRPFELPAAQLETIRLVLAANPRTVVVVNAGGAVDLQRFADRTPALLWAWYPGQEGGTALADVLFGDVNPSAKLPVTFAKRYADYPSAPFYNVRDGNKTPYTEGLFVGYRGFDAHKVEPAFPFGYGLSYTTFEYSDLRASSAADGSAQVAVKVTNRGKRAGDEIVEVYVAPPGPNADRPPKELKGFARVSLEPGETKDVELDLEPRAFAFWDTHTKQWTVAAGAYEVIAAASASDVRARRTVEVGARVLPL